jgi:hypothetical protein
MASTAAAPPSGPHEAGAAPADGSIELLRSALAAAETLLLGACAHATPSVVAALGDTAALLSRASAVKAAASSLCNALTMQQPAADGADGGGDAAVSEESVEFSSLPHCLVVRVLAALPADVRLRCAEVCRAWRTAVSDRTLWLCVDLSPARGVVQTVNDALLLAVAARVAGHMQALRLPASNTDGVTEDALLAVLQANSSQMRELHVTSSCEDVYFPASLVEQMLDAAPRLRLFRTNVVAPVREAARVLRNEAPFGPLRVRVLHIDTDMGSYEDDEEEEEEPIDGRDLLALAAAMRKHASLQGLWLEDVPLDTPAVLDAFIDAALERRLSQLRMDRCSLSHASAAALARLLGSVALTQLWIDNDENPLLDAPAAALLADALRANTTLQVLELDCMDLWSDVAAGVAVMRALTAHPSVRVLSLFQNQAATVDAAAAAGAALGALVAANAPALHDLYVESALLSDAGLAPLLDALAANTHLLALDISDNAMSAAFARDTFLPAIRANSSLRELAASNWWGGEEYGAAPEEVFQAEAFVKARNAADTAAASAVAA